MDWLSVLAVGLHLVFSAIWIGAIIYFTIGILPIARDGAMNAGVLGPLVSKLQLSVRVSAILVLASGSFLAGTRYTFDRLFQTGEGHLVLTMILLWLVLAILSEFGSKRLADGVAETKVREPAHASTIIFRIASIVGIILFGIGAALSAPLT